MAEIDVDALEALARSATPGPWFWDARDGHLRSATVLEESAALWGYGTVPEYGQIVIVSDTGSPPAVAADAAYLAAVSPEVVLALIARLRAAERRIAAATA